MNLKDECEGLWSNAKDAIMHALEHLRELAFDNRDKVHHLKWSNLERSSSRGMFL